MHLENNGEGAQNLKTEIISFTKTLLHKSACYKISLCTHETSTINTKILYKLNGSSEWEMKNEHHRDILITSGRKPSLANTKQ